MEDHLNLSLTTHAPEQTAALALRLGAQLAGGDTILLHGPVGAGKSHFCRALIQSRLATVGRMEDVPSPSFTLVQTYDLGTVELWHADLYRLGDPQEVLELGLEDAFSQAICLV
ncbi:MAG: tRNA (adenosine(37)-N6)-threonylcarbamoyltransferase complex ATPase subunit type 1 TsaE, partial [Roseinatronobacter sp.]